MTLWFVGMTSKEVFFAGLDPPLSSCQRMGPVRSNRGIFTALSAAGRRNGRWSACLVPRLIVESWQGVSIEPLKLAPNWGSIKQCPPGSLVGCPGPWRRTKVEPNVGSALLRWRLFLSRAAASMHLHRCHHQKKTRSKRSVRENVDPLT